MKWTHSKILWVIIIFSIGIRLINITQPLLEGASTRQVQTAMIAQNFHEREFRLFYPQVDGLGHNPGYLMQEFYFIPFAAALFYKLFGGVHEFVLRLISVVFFGLALMMFYLFCSYIWNSSMGLLASLCFSLCPMTIYLGRAVHPEMAITFFNIGTLYFFKKLLDQNFFRYGVYATACFIFSVALKVPNLYLMLPIAYWIYEKYSLSFIRDYKFWLLGFLFVLPIGILNYHQYLVRTEFPNPYMTNFEVQTIMESIRAFLLDKDFYKIQFDNLISYTLTPIGFTLALGGMFLSFNKNKDLFLYFWLIGVGVFFFLMPAQSLQGYYQMHLIPIAVIFISKFLYFFYESNFYKKNFIYPQYTWAVLLILTGIIVFRYSFAWYKIPEHFQYVVEAGKAVSALIDKKAMVVSSSIQNGPELVYYSRRKGWVMDIGKDNNLIESLEKMRKEGAAYFTSASLDSFFHNASFSEYLLNSYPILKQTDHFIIFDLKNKKSSF